MNGGKNAPGHISFLTLTCHKVV